MKTINYAIAQLPVSDEGRFLTLTGEFDINLSSGTFSSDNDGIRILRKYVFVGQKRTY